MAALPPPSGLKRSATLSRRRVLAVGVGVCGAVLTGCVSPARIRAAVFPRLVLPPSPIRGWDTAISRAWRSARLPFALEFSPGDGGGPPPDAEWVHEAQEGAAAAELLKAVNFPLTSLAGWAVDAFSTSGALTAFPVGFGQLQFYVNTKLLSVFGLRDMHPWSWAGLENAAATTREARDVQGGNVGGWIGGWGWGLPATWRALVYGLSGIRVRVPVLSSDFAAIAATTTRLVHLAQGNGWAPFEELSNPIPVFNTVHYDEFAQDGFRNPEDPPNQALFAFMPPPTMDVYEGTIWGGSGIGAFPPSCYVGGGCALPTRQFPTLPMHNVAPTFAWGLRPAANAVAPERLAAFAKWLYQPGQQNALITLALPPVIKSTSLQSTFAKTQAYSSRLPRFDPARYFSPSSAFMPSATQGKFVSALSPVGSYAASLAAPWPESKVASKLALIGL